MAVENLLAYACKMCHQKIVIRAADLAAIRFIVFGESSWANTPDHKGRRDLQGTLGWLQRRGGTWGTRGVGMARGGVGFEGKPPRNCAVAACPPAPHRTNCQLHGEQSAMSSATVPVV